MEDKRTMKKMKEGRGGAGGGGGWNSGYGEEKWIVKKHSKLQRATNKTAEQVFGMRSDRSSQMFSAQRLAIITHQPQTQLCPVV